MSGEKLIKIGDRRFKAVKTKTNSCVGCVSDCAAAFTDDCGNFQGVDDDLCNALPECTCRVFVEVKLWRKQQSK